MSSGYNPAQKSTLSITPIIHRRNHQATSTSGGYVNQKTLGHTAQSKEVGSHLRIAPTARYDVKDGFGETGPQKIKEFPRLLAAEHLFIPPPEPEVIQMDDVAVESQPLLFKKELESIQDYQNWLNDTVDPFLKDLKMVILQGKPDSLHDYVLQYVNALETGGSKPTTIDRDEYEMAQKMEKKEAERKEREEQARRKQEERDAKVTKK